MELGLNGRVALITGGSMGIGKASALALAREGVRVAICARGKERLEAAAKEISDEAGVEVLPIVADMNKEADAQRFVSEATSHFGRLDILVNNAGGSPGGRLENLEESDWMQSLNLKFMGYVRTCKVAVSWGPARYIFIWVRPHLQGRCTHDEATGLGPHRQRNRQRRNKAPLFRNNAWGGQRRRN